MLCLSKALGAPSCPQPGCDIVISEEIRCLPQSCPRITAYPKQEAGDWTQPPVTPITLSGATSRALSPPGPALSGAVFAQGTGKSPHWSVQLVLPLTILSSGMTPSLRFTAPYQAQHKTSANPPSPAVQVQKCWKRGSLGSAGALLPC